MTVAPHLRRALRWLQGITIDSIDGHDGFNPAKGHIGAPLFPAALMFGHVKGISGKAFLEAIAMGYEFGARASVAQHATVPDYHTSGSWGAVTAAAAGARITGMDREHHPTLLSGSLNIMAPAAR